MRWGDRLEFVAEAGPGDFIYVPPFVPHQEINASDETPLSCVLVRSGQEPVVVNLDLPGVEPNPENCRVGRRPASAPQPQLISGAPAAAEPPTLTKAYRNECSWPQNMPPSEQASFLSDGAFVARTPI